MKRIKKAVIPAAGAGTRLLPETKAVPKVFLPVLSRGGRLIPAIHAIIAEALSVGIERVALVVSPEDEPFFRKYFLEGVTPRAEKALSRSAAAGDMLEEVERMGRMIDLLVQEEAEGFGHAVAQAGEWVGSEPFLLLLGDHLYRSRTDGTCAIQLFRAHEKLGGSIVGVSRLPERELSRRGIVAGEPLGSPAAAYHAVRIMEKPEVHVARKELRTPGLSEGYYLALFGSYILQPEIFPILNGMIQADKRFMGEIQLTHGLDELRFSGALFACEIDGESFDMGCPECYRRAFGALVEQ